MTPITKPTPTHRIYNVTGDGRKASWTEIGAAWPNKDGEGFLIACAAMPLTGRLVMRRITEKRALGKAEVA